MLDTIVQDLTVKVKVQLPTLVEDLEQSLSFDTFEHSLRTLTQEMIAMVVGPVLNQVLQDEALLRRLRQAAGEMGYKIRVFWTLSWLPQPEQCVIEGLNSTTGGLENRVDTDTPLSNAAR